MFTWTTVLEHRRNLLVFCHSQREVHARNELALCFEGKESSVLKSYLFIINVDLKRERERPTIQTFTTQILSWLGMGQDKARDQELHPGVPGQGYGRHGVTECGNGTGTLNIMICVVRIGGRENMRHWGHSKVFCVLCPLLG